MHREGSQYILNYSRCFRKLDSWVFVFLFFYVFAFLHPGKAQVRAREVILELASSVCTDGGIEGAGLRCMAWRCVAVRLFLFLN